jgi:hypothetical protein
MRHSDFSPGGGASGPVAVEARVFGGIFGFGPNTHEDVNSNERIGSLIRPAEGNP